MDGVDFFADDASCLFTVSPTISHYDAEQDVWVMPEKAAAPAKADASPAP